MRRTEISRKRLVIGAEFGQHLFRGDVLVIIVLQALMSGDVTDRPQRRSANFARTLGNIVGHRKDLFGVFIEKKVIVPEVLSGHMPMEILSLQVQHEYVGQ